MYMPILSRNSGIGACAGQAGRQAGLYCTLLIGRAERPIPLSKVTPMHLITYGIGALQEAAGQLHFGS